MAKLKQPLFSFEASGPLAGSLTYQRSPAGPRVISRPSHLDSLTPRQIEQRLWFLEAAFAWHSLSASQQAAYRALGAQHHQTGYQRFIACYLSGAIEGHCRLLMPLLEGRGQSATDKTPYANNGTISGATWQPSSVGITALYFDGTNDVITIPTAQSMRPTAGLTLEAILCPTDLAPRQMVYHHQYDSYYLDNYAGGNDLRLQIILLAPPHVDLPASGALTPAVWQHVLATWDGDSGIAALYHNGSQLVTQTRPGTARYWNGSTHIGASHPPSQMEYTGYVLAPRLLALSITPLQARQRYASLKKLFPFLA